MARTPQELLAKRGRGDDWDADELEHGIDQAMDTRYDRGVFVFNTRLPVTDAALAELRERYRGWSIDCIRPAPGTPGRTHMTFTPNGD